MHYVERSSPPPTLSHYQEHYAPKWIDYYCHRQGSKPTDDYWTKPEIREPLIQDFEDNCGYCGVGMGRRPSKSAQGTQVDGNKTVEAIPLGKVDHFLPKSWRPDLVYDWENYIWSCEGCNTTKSDYYDLDYDLLNPTKPKDVASLELRQDGKYHLKQEYEEDQLLKKRFLFTQINTLINVSHIADERKAIKHELELLLQELVENQKWCSSDAWGKIPVDIREHIQNRFKSTIGLLQTLLNRHHYKKMTDSIVLKGLNENPVLRDIFAVEHLPIPSA